MSDCHYPFGYFCSSIRQLEAVQYIKTILGEYFNGVCRLFSNFTYLGFSLCRMSKVGKDHGKLIEFINKLKMKNYALFCYLLSAGALKFDINLDMPSYEYPVSLIQNSNRYWFLNPSYVVIIAFNVFYDFLNYFIFVIVHLVVDIVLITKMKRVLAEKERKVKQLNMKGLEKVIEENKKSKRRLIFMIVSSFLLNFLTKTPLIITSLNDSRILISKSNYQENNIFFQFNFISEIFII